MGGVVAAVGAAFSAVLAGSATLAQAVIVGAVSGAVVGAASSLITGEDVLEGALTGAAVGGATGGIAHGLGAFQGATAAEKATETSAAITTPSAAAESANVTTGDIVKQSLKESALQKSGTSGLSNMNVAIPQAQQGGYSSLTAGDAILKAGANKATNDSLAKALVTTGAIQAGGQAIGSILGKDDGESTADQLRAIQKYNEVADIDNFDSMVASVKDNPYWWDKHLIDTAKMSASIQGYKAPMAKQQGLLGGTA